MSTLKVDVIQKADGTGSLSVPAESGTVVTTASPSLGRRNLIINGAMQVDQRNAGASISTAGVRFSTDRWFFLENSSETATQQQVTDAPEGFAYSFKFTNSATPSTPDYAQLVQRIEGYNVAHLGFGTSAAKTITVSFWVKSSVTGDYSISLRNSASNRSNVSTYTINSASTWEYKTVTFVGDTSGTWLTTNGNGLELIFRSGGSGGTSTLDSWTATGDAFATGSINIMGTASATWQITGVQLEVGSVATPFEHRSYGEELALCQRYCQVLGGTFGGTFDAMATGSAWNGTDAYIQYALKQSMRTTPSLTVTGGASVFRFANGGTEPTPSSITFDQAGINTAAVRMVAASSVLTANQAVRLYNPGTNGGLIWDAEL